MSDDDVAGLPAPGALIDGKYRRGPVLGRGGMAVVYEATQLLTERTVAIKCLLPRVARSAEVVERFLREARAATAIDHPGVVAVLDVGRIERTYYLVMEKLTGETLRERIDRAPLECDEALRILLPICDAVAAAHAKGIIHRDLKPENVFLRRNEDGSLRDVKVLDFGISKLTQEESLTLTGALLGTPYYLSPEQASSSKDVGPASDVYQLGVILFEMLARRVPFDGGSFAEILASILVEPAPSLAALRPDVPPPVTEIVARAMRKSIAERPPDARSLARELAPFAGGVGGVERASVRGTEAPRSSGAAPVDPLAATALVARSPAPRGGAPSGRAWWAAATLVGVGACVGAVVTVLVASPHVLPSDGGGTGAAIAAADGADRATAASASSAAAAARVVRVESSPAASVTVDGAPAGSTPIELRVGSDRAIAVVLRAAGHESRELRLDRASPASISIELAPTGASTPVPEPEPVPALEPPHPPDTRRSPRRGGARPRAGELSADDF